MAEHKALIRWERKDSDFAKGRFSRAHTWTFDGGVTVPGSPAPSVVPAPMSDPSAVDPEEALVAALSSCHMLTFLWLASKGGFVVDRYEDDAVGTLAKNERGVPWVSTIDLHPRIVWGGDRTPTAEELAALHHKAHEFCYIANTIKSDVRIA